jgi:hypothetical protein
MQRFREGRRQRSEEKGRRPPSTYTYIPTSHIQSITNPILEPYTEVSRGKQREARRPGGVNNQLLLRYQPP